MKPIRTSCRENTPPPISKPRWVVQINKQEIGGEPRSSVTAWLASDSSVRVTRGFFSTHFSATTRMKTEGGFRDINAAMGWAEQNL